MFDNIVLVREINAILKYSPNKNDNSFYKTYKMPKNELDRQIRVSSHGTYLKFWVEQDYNPSFGINLSIVFTSNGIPTNDCIIDSETNEISKDCNPCIMNQDLTGNICKPRHVQGYNQKKRPFYVTQYVYNCENFDGSELNALIVAIKTASQTGIYNDPFADIESKKAIETKLYPKDRENENKTYKTMKQKIRLTESQLYNVIKKCVNEALETGNMDKTGYYVGSLEGEKADHLYDSLAHNECGVEYAINYVAKYGECSWDYSENDIETIPSDSKFTIVYTWRDCVLVYDRNSGIFDLYDIVFYGK